MLIFHPQPLLFSPPFSLALLSRSTSIIPTTAACRLLSDFSSFPHPFVTHRPSLRSQRSYHSSTTTTMKKASQTDLPPETQLPKVESIANVATTHWLSLDTINYKDEEGNDRKWNVARRNAAPNQPNKTLNPHVDAVVIIPILTSNQKKEETWPQTVIVEQYRPPMDSITWEFPAGLIDKGETPGQAAIRELKEEVGLVGTISSSSQQLCMSPGLCDETINIVSVNVDMDDELNKNPKQNLDEGEFIKTKTVSLDSTLQKILDDGVATNIPISILYAFSLGLKMGLSLPSKSG